MAFESEYPHIFNQVQPFVYQRQEVELRSLRFQQMRKNEIIFLILGKMREGNQVQSFKMR